MSTYDHSDVTAVSQLLEDYFDGLYEGDLAKFERVFHPAAHLYSTDGTTVTDLPRQEYFEIIAGRPSPAAQSLARHDRILAIQQAGPNTALATVQCAIPPLYFTDYLTVMKGPTGWQIVSKSFHTDVYDG